MSRPAADPMVRLWGHIDRSVDPDACWTWTGCTNRWGYGIIQIEAKIHMVHRLVYELTNGVKLGKACALHKCDNPTCCNPAHIFPGTRAENNYDRMSKGRRHGGGHRFTRSNAAVIKYRLGNGERQTDLAEEYGVTVASIWRIAKGLRFQNVSAAPSPVSTASSPHLDPAAAGSDDHHERP